MKVNKQKTVYICQSYDQKSSASDSAFVWLTMRVSQMFYYNVLFFFETQCKFIVICFMTNIASAVPSPCTKPNCKSSISICCLILCSKTLSITFIACSSNFLPPYEPLCLHHVSEKTSTYINSYKLRNSCLILIIFDIKIPHII